MSKPRRTAARTDGNHNLLVQAAVAVGAMVIDVHALPGSLDLLIGFRGQWHLIEVKDPAQPPSKRRLTEAEIATVQQALHLHLPVWVIETVDELYAILGVTEDTNLIIQVVTRTQERSA